jgi:hypothetical protein
MGCGGGARAAGHGREPDPPGHATIHRRMSPRVLFAAPNGEYDRTGPVRAWDASPDGQRFLMLRNSKAINTPVTTIHVVLNWTEELKRRVPAR